MLVWKHHIHFFISTLLIFMIICLKLAVTNELCHLGTFLMLSCELNNKQTFLAGSCAISSERAISTTSNVQHD